jgi:predicted RecB family nuclease
MYEAYLHCRTKCFLYRDSAVGEDSDFIKWQDNVQKAYEHGAWDHLASRFHPKEIFLGTPSLPEVQSHRYKLIGQYEIATADFQASLSAIKLAPIDTSRHPVEYQPVRAVGHERVSDNDRLCLAFDALTLSSVLGHGAESGTLVHGKQYRTVTIHLAKWMNKARRIVALIREHENQTSQAPLILNRHCGGCEFQLRCRTIATDHDDLSLLAKFSEKEWKQQHDKGIFTVTQLSYTFRPRKRLTKLSGLQQHALRALAIRTNKIHVFGSVGMGKAPMLPVYVDVEGDPDRDFYYLIGLRLRRDGANVQYSFWADDPSSEKTMWAACLQVLATLENPRLVHYGKYETDFFKRMQTRYREYSTPTLDAVVAGAVNILPSIYGHIFFPVYSNGLKDIANFLGFHWSERSASGRKALVWRSQFERTRDPNLKLKLTTYNADDCEALQLVAEKVWLVTAEAPPGETVDVGLMKRQFPQRFGEPGFVLPEFNTINEAAHWDHQRSRVYIRTLPKLSKVYERKVGQRANVVPSKVVCLDEQRPQSCPFCGATVIYKWGTLRHTVYDLRFGRTGIRRWVTRFVFHRFICWTCKRPFQVYSQSAKYGNTLVAYVLYQLLELRLSQNIIAGSLLRVFGLPFSRGGINHIKSSAAKKYRPCFDTILRRLVGGKLLHVDETQAKVKGQDGYVWVFTSLEDVAYVYRPTREAEFLHEMLKEFTGVLVSDFYSGYDSLSCPQQKCLIHLMRDVNEDLRKQPFNGEMKNIAERFGELLKPIVASVDRFGLKKRHLRKHKAAVEAFFDGLERQEYETEVARAYRNRFEKNRDRLFTFLDYDGVPWNNNNAEHAIKAFARLRRNISGTSTAKGIEDYLILLSISETCKAKGVDVLDFFLSETVADVPT